MLGVTVLDWCQYFGLAIMVTVRLVVLMGLMGYSNLNSTTLC